MSWLRRWSCTVGTDQRSSRTAPGHRGPPKSVPVASSRPRSSPPPKSQVPPGWRRAGSRRRTRARGHGQVARPCPSGRVPVCLWLAQLPHDRVRVTCGSP